MIRSSFLLLTFLYAVAGVYAQKVEVSATTEPRRVKEILRKQEAETRANRAYTAEEEKCRNLIRARNLEQAEVSCKLALSLVDKLSKDRILERALAKESLGVVFLRQYRLEEAIALFNQSLEAGRSKLDDSDSETGEIYYFLGQAHHLLGEIVTARDYYERAEKTYRTAFSIIDYEEIRSSYPRSIRNIVEAHYILVTSAGLSEEAVKLKARLAQVEKDFAKYLAK